MDVVIASLTVPETATVVRQGGTHPELGRFLHGGTYCTVSGLAPAETEMRQALAAYRRGAAGRGLPVSILDAPSAADLDDAGRRGALCLLVADAAASPPLALLYGRGLPALGLVQPCTAADLEGTLTSLAGGAPGPGRHLLHEHPEDWDPELEQQLTLRLRQLYGE